MKSYDEKDMPHVADAYDELEELVFEQAWDQEKALMFVADKYELSLSDQSRIFGWLEDEIATQAGDAEAQKRLDEDHQMDIFLLAISPVCMVLGVVHMLTNYTRKQVAVYSLHRNKEMN